MARHGESGAVGPPGLCQRATRAQCSQPGCQGNVKNMGVKMVFSDLGKSLCHHHPGKEMKGGTIENGLHLCEECMKCPSAVCRVWAAR